MWQHLIQTKPSLVVNYVKFHDDSSLTVVCINIVKQFSVCFYRIPILSYLKTFKDSFYSSEKHFLFDNCGFWVCEIKVFLWNLAIVSDGI